MSSELVSNSGGNGGSNAPRRRGRPAGSASFNRVQKELIKSEIAERYLRHETQSQIAAALGISQGQVSRDLKEIKAQWQADALVDYHRRLGNEVARLDHIERQAYAAWERSQKRKVKDVKIGRPAEGDNSGARLAGQTREQIHTVQMQQVVEDTPGDPRFLALALKCIEQRGKWLGLSNTTPAEAPAPSVEVRESGSSLQPDFSQMGPEERRQLVIDTLMRAAQRGKEAVARGELVMPTPMALPAPAPSGMGAETDIEPDREAESELEAGTVEAADAALTAANQSLTFSGADGGGHALP